ncbi:MAG: tetratricopeptide repeat protein [Alteromonadaceae bacterium]|nr:tetratricopeptide repeat protein [Alteromonadaceae bacterium]
MRNYQLVYLIFSVLLLSSCQASSSLSDSQNITVREDLFNDQAFTTYIKTVIETEQQIFHLDDDIKRIVAERIIPVKDPQKRAKKLLRQIFKNRSIGIVYSSSANLVASEAFHNNTANCLSLTIMAYALAKEANLNMRFQQVDIPEYWVRNEQYNMLTGHVNLLLLTDKFANTQVIYGRGNLQIDFDPYVSKKTFPSHLIDKKRVVAMFYTNKGAQALVDNHYDIAYAYLKAAVVTDPSFSNGWGNLGLLYRLSNYKNLAEQTYLHALNLDAENNTVLSNYAYLLKMNGNFTQYENITRKLENKRKHNPYYQALLADEANYQGDYKAAIQYYKKAIKLNSNIHEFYFELAKIYYRLNALNKAKKAMRKAIALNHIPRTERQYVAKLNFLKTVNQTYP